MVPFLPALGRVFENKNDAARLLARRARFCKQPKRKHNRFRAIAGRLKIKRRQHRFVCVARSPVFIVADGLYARAVRFAARFHSGFERLYFFRRPGRRTKDSGRLKRLHLLQYLPRFDAFGQAEIQQHTGELEGLLQTFAVVENAVAQLD